MKKINYKLLAPGFVLCLLTLVSCKDSFLKVEPYGSLNEEVLKTKEGIDKLLVGAYNGLRGGSYTYGPQYLSASDDYRMGTEGGVSTYDVMRLEPSSVNSGKWQFHYQGIQRANDVIKLAPDIEELSDFERTQLMAEARFLRGYQHFHLALFWKNIPWVDESVNYNEENYYISNTVPIYPKIEEDLQFAMDNLSETKPNVGQANKWAAASLLARVYLQQQKYSEAKPLLENIIANGQTSNGLTYDLNESYHHNFYQDWKNGPEAVFVVQNAVNVQGSQGNIWDMYDGTFGGPATCCYGWNQGTWDHFDASQTDPETGLPLLDTYRDNHLPTDQGLEGDDEFTPYEGTLDPRHDWTRGRRGIPYLDWGVHPGKPWIRNQFTSGPFSAIKNIAWARSVERDRQGGGGQTNNPLNIIRFADVLLMAAECEVEIGTLAQAEAYVNRVRARAADPASFVYKYIDDSDPQAGFSDELAANYFVGLYDGHFAAQGQSFARKAVRHERRMELAAEHIRAFDLRRWDGNDFDLKEYMDAFWEREGNLYPEEFDPSNEYLIKMGEGGFVRGRDELHPIPQVQIDLMQVSEDEPSVLEQNPGY